MSKVNIDCINEVSSNVSDPISDYPNVTFINSNIDHADIDVGDSRAKKPTEDYLSWQRDTCLRNFKSACSLWKRKAIQVETTLCNPQDVNAIREKCYGLSQAMESVTVNFKRLSEVKVLNLDKCSSEYDFFEGETLQIVKNVRSTISDLLDEQKSTRSRTSSTRHKSMKSDASSHSSEKANFAIEAAALRAKLKFMDIEAQLEKTIVLRDIEVAEAKFKAIVKLEREDEVILDQQSIDVPEVLHSEYTQQYVQSLPDPPLDDTEFRPLLTSLPSEVSMPHPDPAFATPPRHHERSTITERPTITKHPISDFASITKCLVEQVQLGRLPSPEPGIFSGDPLTYPSWKAAFESLIEQKGIPESEQLHYLNRYLGGAPKEAVEGFFVFANNEAFRDAKDLLDKRYGDPFLIANAFRTKLDRWPKIYSTDPIALQKFADFLKQCERAMNSVGNLAVLNDHRENQRLLTKLPDWIIPRWSRRVAEWKTKYGSFPPFGVFVRFLVDEADMACDPVTSLYALRELENVDDRRHIQPHTEKKSFNRKVHSSFATETTKPATGKDSPRTYIDNRNTSVHSRVDEGVPRVSCRRCKQGHHLDDCNDFLSLVMNDRKEFIVNEGLCFACLEYGHISRNCPRRRQCKKCRRFHPSSLHIEYCDAETQMKTVHASNSLVGNVNRTERTRQCSMIVPVWVTHDGNPKHEVLVYALLDTQSDTTFMTQNLYEDLNKEGTDVTLILSTMSSVNMPVRSKKITGIKIRGFDSQVIVPLPDTYTRDMIPVNRQHIPSPNIASQWPHLRRIEGELMPVDDNIEVGLLIGYNCSQALAPRDVLVADGSDPYGQRTDLGWGIVGIVNPSSSDVDGDVIGFSHRILTYENPCTSRTVRVSPQTTIKKTVTPHDIRRTMELDFTEEGCRLELLHFSDASTQDYGQVSYLRTIDGKDMINCSFLKGKARVTPIKPVTIPRHELTASLVSVKAVAFLKKALEVDISKEVYCTDSKIVLGYINNDSRRFHVFVDFSANGLATNRLL